MAARGSIRVRCAICRKAGIKDGYMLGDKRVCKHKDELNIKNYLAIYPTPSGKPETCTCDTAADADIWIADAKLRYHRNPDLIKKKPVPFETYALAWLEIKKKSKKISVKTWTCYESIVRTHLIKFFGSCLMSNITPKMIENLRESIQDKSPSIQQKVSIALNSILRMASRDELIRKNPSADLDNLDTEIDINYNFLEPNQAKDFLGSVTDPFLHLYYKLPIYTGLRAGEVTGLMWDCVNFDARWIEIKRVLVWLTKKEMARKNWPTPWMVKPAPKTKAGFRKIDIDENLVKELQIFKIEQPENRFNFVFAKKKVIYDKKHSYGYPNEPMPIHPGVLNPTCFKRDAKAAGLPEELKYHELRHTFCSLCYVAGIPESMVLYYMGHKDAAVTRGIYRHLMEAEKRKGAGFAQKLANMIDSKPENIAAHV